MAQSQAAVRVTGLVLCRRWPVLDWDDAGIGTRAAARASTLGAGLGRVQRCRFVSVKTIAAVMLRPVRQSCCRLHRFSPTSAS